MPPPVMSLLVEVSSPFKLELVVATVTQCCFLIGWCVRRGRSHSAAGEGAELQQPQQRSEGKGHHAVYVDSVAASGEERYWSESAGTQCCAVIG